MFLRDSIDQSWKAFGTQISAETWWDSFCWMWWTIALDMDPKIAEAARERARVMLQHDLEREGLTC